MSNHNYKLLIVWGGNTLPMCVDILLKSMHAFDFIIPAIFFYRIDCMWAQPLQKITGRIRNYSSQLALLLFLAEKMTVASYIQLAILDSFYWDFPWNTYYRVQGILRCLAHIIIFPPPWRCVENGLILHAADCSLWSTFSNHSAVTEVENRYKYRPSGLYSARGGLIIGSLEWSDYMQVSL